MFRLPSWNSLSSSVKIILALQTIFFVLGIIPGLKDLLLEWGAFYGADVLLRPWSLVSYQFLHGGPFHFLLNMLLFWMISGEITRAYSSKAFYALMIGGGAVAALLSIPVYSFLGEYPLVIGFSGSVMAMLMVYGRMFPERQVLLFFVVPVPMKYAVFVFAALDLFSIGSATGIAHVVHLIGFLYGFAFFYWCRPSLVSQNPWGTEGLSSWRASQANEPLVRKGNAKSETFIEENVELDSLLKKISEHGVSSLTEAEQQKLDAISHKKRVQTGKVIPFHRKDRK